MRSLLTNQTIAWKRRWESWEPEASATYVIYHTTSVAVQESALEWTQVSSIKVGTCSPHLFETIGLFRMVQILKTKFCAQNRLCSRSTICMKPNHELYITWSISHPGSLCWLTSLSGIVQWAEGKMEYFCVGGNAYAKVENIVSDM